MIPANETIRRILFIFSAAALVASIAGGCTTGKGFKLSIETGGSEQKNMGVEQQTSFVSDETKPLPEITGDEYEQLGDTLLSKGNLYLAYVQYEKSLKLNPGTTRVEYKKGLALLLGGEKR